MSADPTKLTAVGIADGVRSGTLRAAAVTDAFLARIRAIDPRLKAFLEVLEGPARAAAAAVDDKVRRGAPVGRLAGVPVAVKDNILVKGARLSCGSRILGDYRAVYDATAVCRLRDADAVIIGKTNLDEFAMGSSCENSAFFPTLNPWDRTRVPGGSSGGSAAAVAARLVPLALGSDTGGSVRQPASFCGIVGMKPGYGVVSRYGLVAYASSFDQIGPLARGTEDAALLLSVIAGHDERDSTSLPATASGSAKASAAEWRKGLRIGLAKEYFPAGLDPEVEAAVRGAAESLSAAGAQIKNISLPHTRAALSAYYIIAPSEASSNLSRFDGVRFGVRAEGGDLRSVYEESRGSGFGTEVKRRIMIGTYALSAGYYDAYYLKAQKVRSLVKADFDAAFADVDLILGPTAPTPAFGLGDKTGDPLQMILADVFTVPCNMAGIAGLSVPCGLSAAGLPIGVQLSGPAGKEGLLFAAAAALEKVRPFPECPEVPQ